MGKLIGVCCDFLQIRSVSELNVRIFCEVLGLNHGLSKMELAGMMCVTAGNLFWNQKIHVLVYILVEKVNSSHKYWFSLKFRFNLVLWSLNYTGTSQEKFLSVQN